MLRITQFKHPFHGTPIDAYWDEIKSAEISARETVLKRKAHKHFTLGEIWDCHPFSETWPVYTYGSGPYCSVSYKQRPPRSPKQIELARLQAETVQLEKERAAEQQRRDEEWGRERSREEQQQRAETEQVLEDSLIVDLHNCSRLAYLARDFDTYRALRAKIDARIKELCEAKAAA